MRVLLTEGSGLTSRQAASRLAASGHVVGVLSAEPAALTRFTRAVRHWHGVPPLGADPVAWLAAATDAYRVGGYDLLLPTQEQVTVLSWASGSARLEGITTVVPSFAALRHVQDKISSHTVLGRLGIPQPRGAILRSADELGQWDVFPVFVKAPVGTATSAVQLVEGRADLLALATSWAHSGVSDEGEGILVQSPAKGPLAMIQSVFDRGRLVASHSNLRVREGARGGASHKRSIVRADLHELVDSLGQALEWHGALSADAILTEDGPLIIDVNPRLVEPGNAWRAGVDLVGQMVEVAMGHAPAPQPIGRPDVNTHQLLLAILGAAQHGKGRRGVLRELQASLRGRGDYADSTEELTPVAHDWRAALPCAAASLATIVKPATWEWFSSGSIDNYAVSPAGWRALCASGPE